MQLNLVQLNERNIPLFEHLIFFPAYQQRVRKEITSILGVGAVVDSNPVAIILADELGEIFYLRTLPQFQNKSIELALIQVLEEWFQNQGIESLSLNVECEAPYNRTLSAALVEKRWVSPNEHLTLSIFETARMQQDSWLEKNFTGKNQQLFPWADLTAEEREDLRAKKYVDYPEVYDPFINEERILLPYSFGIRESGKVTGWILCEEVAQNMVLVRTIYTANQYSSRRAGLSLLSTCFLNIRSREEYPFVLYAIENNNTDAMRLIGNRFRSGVIREKIYLRARKNLR